MHEINRETFFLEYGDGNLWEIEIELYILRFVWVFNVFSFHLYKTHNQWLADLACYSSCQKSTKQINVWHKAIMIKNPMARLKLYIQVFSFKLKRNGNLQKVFNFLIIIQIIDDSNWKVQKPDLAMKNDQDAMKKWSIKDLMPEVIFWWQRGSIWLRNVTSQFWDVCPIYNTMYQINGFWDVYGKQRLFHLSVSVLYSNYSYYYYYYYFNTCTTTTNYKTNFQTCFELFRPKRLLLFVRDKTTHTRTKVRKRR